MYAPIKHAIVPAFVAILTAGCGTSADTQKVTQKSTPGTAPVAEVSGSESQQDLELDLSVSNDAGNIAPQPSPESVGKSSDARVATQPTETVAPAKEQADPSTAKAAIKIVDLLELPRFGQKNAVQSGPTYLYYSGEGTLKEADQFYQQLLASRGWREIPPLTPPTDQYVDRLFENQGYYVRASVSLGGQRGELGIMLSNLGNVDVRQLPRLPDADIAGAPSTPVNVTFKTASSIPDATDAIHKLLSETGWQQWQEFHHTPIDVPHYRDLHFRKEACRLNVGVLTNPQNPADRTTVFYHAEYVTPFDIPTLDATKILKLDLTSARAGFETSDSRQELVSLLQKNSSKYGWKIAQTDKFVAGEFHMLPIDVDSGAYLVARLVESAGKYSASLESFSGPPTSPKESVDAVASNEPSKIDREVPNPIDEVAENLESQINQTIQAELSKALGSLGSQPAKTPANLAELQAMASGIEAILGNSDEKPESEEAADDADAENPFDVPEDTTAPSAEVQAFKQSIGKLKYGNESYDLPHVACYVVKEHGRATKCILLSDSPINVEKLKRMLAKEGQPIHGTYVSEKSKALLDLRVSNDSVSLNAQIASMSMGLSSGDIKSETVYYQGKISGKVGTLKPIEVGGQAFQFAVRLNQPVVKVEWSKANPAEPAKLVADDSKEYLVPENCNQYSSEGSRYSNQIEASIDAPLAAVQAFYVDHLNEQGWKLTSGALPQSSRYQRQEQELVLKLDASGTSDTMIRMQVRDVAAARADMMVPPSGKAMLVLGNMSDSNVVMSIGGKSYRVAPSKPSDPTSATRVVVEPGAIKVQVKVESGNKTFDMDANVTANSTWGVLFDLDFRDVLRLF